MTIENRINYDMGGNPNLVIKVHFLFYVHTGNYVLNVWVVHLIPVFE